MSSVSGRAALAAAFLSAPLLACGDGAGPPSPAQVLVTDGDRQVAPVNTLLPAPIVVTVLDGGGQPLPGVRIEWRTPGADRLIPIDPKTDAAGRARAQWLLGQDEGQRLGQAELSGVQPAVFTAVGEGEQWMPFDQFTPLDIATYDGSGQVVHPDYAATPAGAFGRPFHLAITPYPYGNASFENPSLFEGNRRDQWAVSNGVTNPIVRPNAGYLSDPDLVYVPERGELRLYYRQATSRQHRAAVALQRWLALDRAGRGGPGAQPRDRVAQRRAARPRTTGGCSPSTPDRRAAPPPLRRWRRAGRPTGCVGAPVPVVLHQPDLWPWHIDVQWIPSRQVFWAVYNVKTASRCTTPAVYLAESTEGSPGRVPQPVLVKGAIPALQDIVYRTTFEYEPVSDAITFWYSGARYERRPLRLGRGGRAAAPGGGVREPRRRRVRPRRAAAAARPPRWSIGRSRFPSMTTLPERFAADPRAASGLPDAAPHRAESRWSASS